MERPAAMKSEHDGINSPGHDTKTNCYSNEDDLLFPCLECGGFDTLIRKNYNRVTIGDGVSEGLVHNVVNWLTHRCVEA